MFRADDQRIATSTHTESEVQRPSRRLPGEEGTWVFIFGDMTVFAILFGVFLYYRSKEETVFATSQAALNQTFGAVNTLLLLTSSLFVVTAVRALRRGARQVSGRLVIGAVFCGCAFVANKALEYGHEASLGNTPTTDHFFLYFYVMTGLHLLHAILGMILLGVMLSMTRRDSLTVRQQGYFEGAGCFWHMVDMLWIIIFALLYLVHT